MRNSVIAALAVAACNSADATESDVQRDLASAHKVEADLDPRTLDKEIPLQTVGKDLGFSPLEVVAKCNDDSVTVKYDPYRDSLWVAFEVSPAIENTPRSLVVNGKRIWAETKPFHGDGMLWVVQGSEKRMPWVAVDSVAKRFHEGTDAQLSIAGTSMVARQTSPDEFAWAARKFDGWRVKLHVFTKEEVDTLAAHKAAAQRAAAALFITAHDGAWVDALRGSTDPEVARVVKHYDEWRAAATKLKEAPIPLPQYKDSLSVEKVRGCR